ncbi:MAG TPA: hypothetical protein VL992_00795 [Tepidisphaeraceae bacterium]|nr:hypothetical protein [Tepidisphaeraceae bacterium]
MAMVDVTLNRDAAKSLERLADEDRQEVERWRDELRAWRPDSPRFVSRTNGVLLGNGRVWLYVLKTDSDTRLAFTKGPKGIEITEILPSAAAKDRILKKARNGRKMAVGHAS